MRRRTATAAVLLIVLGLLTAFGAAHARHIGSRLTESHVEVGGTSAFTPDPGNEAAFAPFAFGVIGPLDGSSGALERGLDELRDAGGVEFVVLLGDVTASGDEGELLGLVATWQDAGVERMAIAGPRDQALATEFEAYVSPMRWWFRHNECLFVGVSGHDGDAEFVDKTTPLADQSAVVFGFSPGDGALEILAPALEFSPRDSNETGDVFVQRVQVLDGGAHAVASWNVSRSSTLRSVARGFELGLLYPLVRGIIGFVLVLLVCMICVGQGFRLLRSR